MSGSSCAALTAQCRKVRLTRGTGGGGEAKEKRKGATLRRTCEGLMGRRGHLYADYNRCRGGCNEMRICAANNVACKCRKSALITVSGTPNGLSRRYCSEYFPCFLCCCTLGSQLHILFPSVFDINKQNK